MKPNFIIAMYCLAIILVKPKVGQAVVIGLLAGLMCQIPMLNATPFVNIVSEVLGALVCGLLTLAPMKIAGKVDANPLVATFLSTVVSGYSFALIVGVAPQRLEPARHAGDLRRHGVRHGGHQLRSGCRFDGSSAQGSQEVARRRPRFRSG